MDKKKLGQEPTFPRARSTAGGKYTGGSVGMSKRLYIATKAMQGLLAASNLRDHDCKKIAEHAFNQADELLKQENDSTF